MVVMPDGVLLLEPQSRVWTGPYTPPDPSLLRRSGSALVDPIDQSLWIQLPDGWLRFQPNIELWEQGSAPGRVSQIAFDADNPAAGLLLLIGSTWYQVPRGASFPNPTTPPRRLIRPLAITEVLRQSTGFAALNGNGIPDGRGGLARFTSAAADPTGRGWWVGTAGAGLLFLPFGQMNAERIPYGLPSSSVAALFVAPNGLWVITDQFTGRRPSISFVAPDLGSVVWHEGPMATGLPFHWATRLVGSEQALWLGTDVGLLRIRNGGDAIDRLDEGRGLPDPQVLTLLARRGRILVGTAHGLAVMNDSGKVSYTSTNYTGRVTGLATVADTAWAGGAVGPMVLRPGGELSEPAGLDVAPSYHLPVLAMTTIADTVIALTTERLEWRDPVSGAWTLGPMLESSLGRLETITAGRGGVFVAGDRGVGHMTLSGLPGRVLTVPLDLPAAPRDLAVDDDYLWVATSAGLVRWRLDAIVP
jgi:ligand-binding sensor domain-containing protein